LSGRERITLQEVETDFKKELADAETWYANLREKEIAWISDGKNPELEFDKLYQEEPTVVSPEDSVFATRNLMDNLPVIGAVVFAVPVAAIGVLVIRAIRARKGQTKSGIARPKHRAADSFAARDTRFHERPSPQ
jgi:hypothetical protein